MPTLLVNGVIRNEFDNLSDTGAISVKGGPNDIMGTISFDIGDLPGDLRVKDEPVKTISMEIDLRTGKMIVYLLGTTTSASRKIDLSEIAIEKTE